MNDIIHLNSIKSDGCDCNKPKKQTQCGCLQLPKLSCYQPINLDGQYFKVSNLFSELKSEWQRAEARSNLGVTDIIDVKLVKRGEDNNGVNDWRMIISKGGIEKEYHFYVRDGEPGKTPKISVGEVNHLPYSSDLVIYKTGTDENVILNFGIPQGKPGKDGADGINGADGPAGPTGASGANGKSAYELAVLQGYSGNLDAWLASLKGLPGLNGAKITSITTDANKTDYSNFIEWNVILNDGLTFKIWIPVSTSTPTLASAVPVFMFYKKTFPGANPTSTNLQETLTNLQRDVNNLDNSGKPVNYLKNLGWKDYPETVTLLGREFIYLAVTTISNDTVDSWKVIQLTGVSGKDGIDGQDCDCSGGGDPTYPIQYEIEDKLCDPIKVTVGSAIAETPGNGEGDELPHTEYTAGFDLNTAVFNANFVVKNPDPYPAAFWLVTGTYYVVAIYDVYSEGVNPKKGMNVATVTVSLVGNLGATITNPNEQYIMFKQNSHNTLMYDSSSSTFVGIDDRSKESKGVKVEVSIIRGEITGMASEPELLYVKAEDYPAQYKNSSGEFDLPNGSHELLGNVGCVVLFNRVTTLQSEVVEELRNLARLHNLIN